jgi:hypothetical protein
LVQNLLQDYKDLQNKAKKAKKAIQADENHTQDEEDAADTALVLARKRYKELQTAYKIAVDEYNTMVAEAAAAAQAALDAAKAIKLTQDEEVALL